ncbi:two component transcriptional regulator, winged helix family [Trichlorobacter thiogenes]|uniref:Two component transcriptional regulator, winged helix family n=1 Tax=Trichlorobacter thiogenes TaxID=115783 RepID=A0A1T4LMM2_9BACT|nr:response regulator transcription factor [Trichlorobacter thiogenes]SJZ56000.1 two component transcriptional regulator, winged helix family [Trichlorobacter thiogenes]
MRVLVVEDEKKVAAFIKRGLEEEGYQVDAVHDGEEAVQQAQAESYDLLILDVMLPSKDGFSVVRELRQSGMLAPVLMLTARDTTDDIVAGLDAGSDDYLTKPFAFAELSARVRALGRRGGRDRGAELNVADLRIDPISRKVWRGDKEIELTIKEYGLLEFLVRNTGSVVTRNMIAEKVWDHSFESFTNIIDVYVNYVRKKVDKGFDRKLIHTVRGQGYTLKAE